MDDSGYVSAPWYWTSCYSSWISIENVCNGLLSQQDNDKVYINPEIVEKSNETLRDSEGCLSAPGKQGDVKRHLRIILKYQDKDGKEEKKTFYNLEARCIQHEMDHLEGRLCIDYEEGEYNRDKNKSETMVESDFRAKSDS